MMNIVFFFMNINEWPSSFKAIHQSVNVKIETKNMDRLQSADCEDSLQHFTSNDISMFLLQYLETPTLNPHVSNMRWGFKSRLCSETKSCHSQYNSEKDSKWQKVTFYILRNLLIVFLILIGHWWFPTHVFVFQFVLKFCLLW